MNKTTLVSVVIIVISGAIGATPFLVDQTSVEIHQQKFNASVTVSDTSANKTSLGLNADPNLDFGDIPRNTNATKFLNVSTAKKSLLDINSEGNISEVLAYKNRMYFQGYQEIPLEVKGRETGSYSGNITLSFQIPKNQVGHQWLSLKYWIYNKL